jgi:hypothetical protein
VKRNRFPAWCASCGEHIPAESGLLDGKDASGLWRVVCPSCQPQPYRRPAPPPPPIAAEDEIIRARMAQIRRDRIDQLLRDYEREHFRQEVERIFSRPAVPRCLEVLGLIPPVDPETVQRRFRELAKKLHPDVGGDEWAFVEVKRAFDDAMSLVGGGRS